MDPYAQQTIYHNPQYTYPNIISQSTLQPPGVDGHSRLPSPSVDSLWLRSWLRQRKYSPPQRLPTLSTIRRKYIRAQELLSELKRKAEELQNEREGEEEEKEEEWNKRIAVIEKLKVKNSLKWEFLNSGHIGLD